MISSSWVFGWNAREQTHNSAMVRQVVLGDSMGYLMNGGDEQTRRFAATVLDN